MCEELQEILGALESDNLAILPGGDLLVVNLENNHTIEDVESYIEDARQSLDRLAKIVAWAKQTPERPAK